MIGFLKQTYRSKVIQSLGYRWPRPGAQNDWSVCTTWLLHEKH
jgi:hypothetical protein